MPDTIVTFQIPTQILFGAGALDRLPDSLPVSSPAKILLVTDRGLRRAGILDQVAAVLEKGGLPFAVFDETEENPSVETVEAATALLRDEACDLVMGLGGGSPMDVAKSVAIMAGNPGSIRDYEGTQKIPHPPLPVVAIPTTAGTGAEVTPFIVITDIVRRFKMTIVCRSAIPALAVVDPALMATMPAPLAAATGMDALTHGIESYVSLLAQPFTEALALHGIRLIGQNLRRGVADRADREAVGNLAIASTMVAAAFSHTRLGNAHALAHPLGGFYNIPHGVANAVLLPHIMAYNAPACPEKMANIAGAMGIDVCGLPAPDGAAAAVEAVRRLMHDIGIPHGLGALGLKEEDIPRLAADAIKSGNIAVNPRPTRLEDLAGLYHAAL